MDEWLARPNPVLDLFRSKAFWQKDHGITDEARRVCGTVACGSNKLHHAIACSILAHDVVATAWLEIHQLLEPQHFALRLYVERWRGETRGKPDLVLDETITLLHIHSPQHAIQSLCKRFDRIDIAKEAIFLRDHELPALVDDPRKAPYPRYWRVLKASAPSSDPKPTPILHWLRKLVTLGIKQASKFV